MNIFSYFILKLMRIDMKVHGGMIKRMVQENITTSLTDRCTRVFGMMMLLNVEQ